MKKCRLCGSERVSNHYKLDNGRDMLYSCDECNFVQMMVDPVDEIDGVASEESIIPDVERDTSLEDMKLNEAIGISGPMSKMAHVLQQDYIRINQTMTDTVSELYSSFDKLNFIDVGSGYGQHSFSLKEKFPDWNFHLLEVSKERIQSGIEAFNVDSSKFTFHHKILDDSFANDNLEKFDISFAFHVLEHVYDIKTFIRNMFEVTKKGGIMLLELPNEADDLSLLSDNYRKIIHFPAHVNHFTKNTLSKLIQESGIEDKVEIDFIATQRYGFFNYIDWIRHNEKSKVLSDDYTPRKNPSWIERQWLQTKKDNFTTDTITMVLKKHDC